jgi:hypothetical protein
MNTNILLAELDRLAEEFRNRARDYAELKLYDNYNVQYTISVVFMNFADIVRKSMQ